MKDEFLRVMDIISIVFRSMNFQNFEAQISLRDKVNREKYIGSDDNWEKAEQAIIEACEEKGFGKRLSHLCDGFANYLQESSRPKSGTLYYGPWKE